MTARPTPSLPTVKKPVTYQPNILPSVPMPHQQDKRKSVSNDSNGHDPSHTGGGSHVVAAIANAFNKVTAHGSDGPRSSRASSVSSNPPGVSDLVRIYTEATGSKQQQKSRSASVASLNKHDELTRIFEQATNRSQRGSTASIVKPTSQAHELPYEEITWDSLVHGYVNLETKNRREGFIEDYRSTPAAPPFPNQWQTATVHQQPPQQQPLEVTRRPSSAASSGQHSSVDNLRDVIASIQQHSAGKTPSSFPQAPAINSHVSSRPSTASHSIRDPREDDDEDDDDNAGRRTPIQQTTYAIISPRQHSRQGSNTDSVQSGVSSSISRHSPMPLTSNPYAQRTSVASIPQQQQEDRNSYRAPSASSSTRRSSERFPPPPQHMETIDFSGETGIKARSISSMSTRSSVYGDAPEAPYVNQVCSDQAPDLLQLFPF